MYYSKKIKRPTLRRNLVYSTPTSKAGFSTASTRALIAAGLETVGDIVAYNGQNPEWKLAHLEGLGPISAKQILGILSHYRDKLKLVADPAPQLPKPTAIAAEVREQIRTGKKTPVKKKRRAALTLDTLVHKAGLSVRSSNALIATGLRTIRDVIEYCGDRPLITLRRIHHVGQLSAEEIANAIQHLRDVPAEPVKLLAPPVKVQPTEDEISFVEWCLENRDWLDLVRDRMTAAAVQATAFNDDHLGEVFD